MFVAVFLVRRTQKKSFFPRCLPGNAGAEMICLGDGEEILACLMTIVLLGSLGGLSQLIVAMMLICSASIFNRVPLFIQYCTMLCLFYSLSSIGIPVWVGSRPLSLRPATIQVPPRPPHVFFFPSIHLSQVPPAWPAGDRVDSFFLLVLPFNAFSVVLIPPKSPQASSSGPRPQQT